MANYKSIAVVGQAIVRVLADSSRNEFPDAEFTFVKPADLTPGKRHPKEGASVCLYHAGIGSEQRNAPPGRSSVRGLLHPEILLTLRFLIIPWGTDAERQTRIMGWIIRTLENTPRLSAAFLNGIVSNEVVFSSEDTVDLVYDPLTLTDLALLIQALRLPNVLSSLTYRAALLLRD